MIQSILRLQAFVILIVCATIMLYGLRAGNPLSIFIGGTVGFLLVTPMLAAAELIQVVIAIEENTRK